MFGEIDALVLGLRRQPEADDLVDHRPQDVGDDEGVARHRQDGNGLLAQQGRPTAHQQTLRTAGHRFRGEQPDQQGADNSAGEVHADDVE